MQESTNNIENILEKLSKQYDNELNLIYANFEKSFSSNLSISNISKYQIFSGGKRIRPLLIFIITNLFSQKINNTTLNFATAIELLHNATLIHDDIIDDSDTRRTKETVKKAYGSSKAILSGDYLFAYAFDYVINLPKRLIIETQKTSLKLIEGEFSELEVNLANITPETSIKIMQDKTASLFSLSSIGAYILNEENINEELLSNFYNLGNLIGVCFQIMDDILDINAPKEITGKAQGTDFIEKKPSLIVTLWLNEKTKYYNEFINAKMLPTELLNNIKSEIDNLNIVSKAKKYFEKYYNEACSIINSLTNCNYIKNKDQLNILQNYLNFIKNKI